MRRPTSPQAIKTCWIAEVKEELGRNHRGPAANRLSQSERKALAYVYDRVAELASLFQVIEPTLSDLLNGAKEIQAGYGLVGNDALTVHLIREHRIPFLATFDTDFSVVSEVTLVAMSVDTHGQGSEP